MANTEHQETLDFLDKLSVCLYRAGISVFAIALVGLAALESQWLDGVDGRYRAVFAVFAIAGAMSASNIHVYSKSVRTIISWSGWIGVILMVCDPELNRVWARIRLYLCHLFWDCVERVVLFQSPWLEIGTYAVGCDDICVVVRTIDHSCNLCASCGFDHGLLIYSKMAHATAL